VKYLLDTHTLIWSHNDPSNLPETVAATLTDPAHDRPLSIVRRVVQEPTQEEKA